MIQYWYVEYRLPRERRVNPSVWSLPRPHTRSSLSTKCWIPLVPPISSKVSWISYRYSVSFLLQLQNCNTYYAATVCSGKRYRDVIWFHNESVELDERYFTFSRQLQLSVTYFLRKIFLLLCLEVFCPNGFLGQFRFTQFQRTWRLPTTWRGVINTGTSAGHAERWREWSELPSNLCQWIYEYVNNSVIKIVVSNYMFFGAWRTKNMYLCVRNIRKLL